MRSPTACGRHAPHLRLSSPAFASAFAFAFTSSLPHPPLHPLTTTTTTTPRRST